MNILHVVRGLANSSGTTHIVIPLAEEQAKRGHDVSVFHVQKPGQESLEPDPDLVESRLFDITIPTRHLGFSVPFAREMRKTVSGFDVVHIHAVWNFVTYWTMRCARKAGVPFVVAPQGSCDPYAWQLGSALRRLYAHAFEIPLLRRASRIQVLTEEEKRQVRRLGIDAPCTVIPNGVYLEYYDRQKNVIPLREKLDLPEGERTLLFLGRLHPKKGLDILAEAFGRLVESVPDITLVIAGDDGGTGYRRKVEEMLDEAGGRDKSRFIGEVRGDEKYRVQLGADAFVLSSYSEGLPVAVVEAMAAGLPVVITHGCNLPEVHESDAGYVVPAEEKAVAAALTELLGDPETMARMGGSARRLVERKFTWEQIGLKAAELYGNLARHNKSIGLSDSA